MSGRIVVVGDVVTDVLASYNDRLAMGTDTGARIELTGGGSAANTAAWLASIGVPVTLVAVVGEDGAGADRIEELALGGVDCAIRRAPEAATGTVMVLSQAGERTMLSDRGANLLLSNADIDTALIGAPDAVHLHLSGYVLLDEASRTAGRYALRAAHERGLTTSVDAGSGGPVRSSARGRCRATGPALFRRRCHSSASMIRGSSAAVSWLFGAGAGSSRCRSRCSFRGSRSLARITASQGTTTMPTRQIGTQSQSSGACALTSTAAATRQTARMDIMRTYRRSRYRSSSPGLWSA